jgi:hypothetical protein
MSRREPRTGRGPAADELVKGYESLRQEVLSNHVGSRLGLAVLLRQGMVGWMDAYSLCQTHVAPALRRRSEEAKPLPPDLPSELGRIVADIVLRRKELD